MSGSFNACEYLLDRRLAAGDENRLALSVRGRDYEWGKSTGARLSNFKNELRGCGPFLHDDPRDRPAAISGGRTTLHFASGQDSYVIVPEIPPRRA